MLRAITGKAVKDAFKAAENLETISAAPVPCQIKSLKEKEKRFVKVIDKTETVNEVCDFAARQ